MRRWILAFSAAAGCVALVSLVRILPTGEQVPKTAGLNVDETALSHANSSNTHGNEKAPAPEPTPQAFPGPHPALAGLDLTRIASDDDGTSAPLPNHRVAHLFVDPDLQRTAKALLAAHHLPEAAIVLADAQTGNVLVYASHVESGPARDLAVEATAPAASVFKIVTGTALIDSAQLTPETEQCYSGGEQRIYPSDLDDDPRRDRWCASLSSAMGRSLNTVFARLALKHLRPKTLEDMAGAYGFGQRLPFDVEVQPSALRIPSEPLEFARTAAGFWNTTLSPLEAASLSATVARGGEAVRLNIVRQVDDADGKSLYAPPASAPTRRVIRPETAQAVTTMMEHTVSEGTSHRAFRDPSGRPFLPGVVVAGKTGTLADADKGLLYTWFTGFAPSRPMPNVRQVVVAALVVNHPAWHLKANVLAREMLRAYFADQKVAHVTAPALSDERPRKSRQPVLSAKASSRPRTSNR
jgi:peptidoglycan glycosyltransferase